MLEDERVQEAFALPGARAGAQLGPRLGPGALWLGLGECVRRPRKHCPAGPAGGVRLRGGFDHEAPRRRARRGAG